MSILRFTKVTNSQNYSLIIQQGKRKYQNGNKNKKRVWLNYTVITWKKQPISVYSYVFYHYMDKNHLSNRIDFSLAAVESFLGFHPNP